MIMSASTPNTDPDFCCHVAVGAVIDAAGRVLIARRPLDKHLGGLWELPGGKINLGEDVLSALRRELGEELGIAVLQARPLIRIPYQYPSRQVFLDVWRVDKHAGEAYGREGQEIRWVHLSELSGFSFPPSNSPIVTALQLPDRYLITPEPGTSQNWPVFLQRLEQALQRGISLVQLRAKSLVATELTELTMQVMQLCQPYRVRVLLNSDIDLALSLPVDGVHLGQQQASSLQQRPSVSKDRLLAISCHNAEELAQANALGADFAVLSPVQPTQSHPGTPALGWTKFGEIVAVSQIPVYALGGMQLGDIATAWQYGAQGIAAIRGLW
ncbi:MAG: Nudix family hydrolase [Thiohalomonadaceae bacterium]